MSKSDEEETKNITIILQCFFDNEQRNDVIGQTIKKFCPKSILLRES